VLEAILISLKWQQSSGTAEQKVPFEVICLVWLGYPRAAFSASSRTAIT